MIISSINTQILAIFLALFASSCVFVSSTSDDNNSHGILVLNEANIDETIKSNKFIAVTFYASWCKLSKKWLPRLDEAGDYLAVHPEIKVVLAKIDADSDENISVQKRYNIEGFPTIHLFKNGVQEPEYSGTRRSKDFINYLKEQTKED